MKKRFFCLLLPAITLVLEILPYGAVLNFGRPAEDGSVGYFRETYSYFDILPFGYANFAPMITGILTCITILFVVAYCFSGKNSSVVTGRRLCLVTAVINLCPLFYGVRYLSLVGILISVSLVAEAWLLTKEIKK